MSASETGGTVMGLLVQPATTRASTTTARATCASFMSVDSAETRFLGSVACMGGLLGRGRNADAAEEGNHVGDVLADPDVGVGDLGPGDEDHVVRGERDGLFHAVADRRLQIELAGDELAVGTARPHQ